MDKRSFTRVAAAALLVGITSFSSLAQNDLKAFLSVSPWTVAKKPDSTCIAIANGFNGDFFSLKEQSANLVLVLANQRFNIPPGKYPVRIGLNGSTIVPSYAADGEGLVEPNKGSATRVVLSRQGSQTMPRAALLTFGLAGNDHLLFLGDTDALFKELALCKRYDNDPLKTAR